MTWRWRRDVRLAIPDLIETRWRLGRFEHVRAWLLQLGLLALDLAIPAGIIIAAISAFRLAQGARMLSPVEMLAGYTPYTVFFYSTFLTPVWTLCGSAWFIRLSAEAVPFLRAACVDGANVRACNLRGWIYQGARGGAQDFGKARELYETACDGGR